MNDSLELTVIGKVRSPFHQKFGAPRQAGLVDAAQGCIEFGAEFGAPECFEELEGFSHLWLIFVFHLVGQGDWHPTVRPPRLGGNQRVGVWASRSPFRPNRIGLSSVKIEKVRASEGIIDVSGVDLVDGTPLLDVKPYIPYCDALKNAAPGYAQLPVSPLADFALNIPESLAEQMKDRPDGDRFCQLVEQTLRADPRPAYHDDPQRSYGMSLAGAEIRWRVTSSTIEIDSIEFSSTD